MKCCRNYISTGKLARPRLERRFFELSDKNFLKAHVQKQTIKELCKNLLTDKLGKSYESLHEEKRH
jgi:hypothetical protein